jgi:CHRD domain
MKGRVRWAIASALVAGAAVAGTAAIGTGGNGGIVEELTGYEEDPLVISTPGSGDFKAHVRAEKEEISYKLSYRDLEGKITQAHIHVGGRAQSGGIVLFLCTNVGGGPMAPNAPQACPPAPATISGTLTPDDVVPQVMQGIGPGEFGEIVDALRVGKTYVNLHSDIYPAGEIRAQLEPGED